MSPASGIRPPWYLLLPAAAAGVGVLLPIVYLCVRATDADWDSVAELVLRPRNFKLLVNTMGLAITVVTGSLAIALPMAWLTTRTDLSGRSIYTLFGVLPLSIPGYVVGYALLALGTPTGPLGGLFPRLTGYVGATIALIIYNFPLMYLNLRTAFINLDPSLAEAARSLGCGTRETFVRVTLPQLWPAMLSGAMLVALYVMGDFGVVSLMRFETFSYAIFVQYNASYDRIYAAWLALMLLAVTGSLVAVEFRLLRDLVLQRSGLGARKQRGPIALGRWSAVAHLFCAAVALMGVVIPVWVIIFWMTQAPLAASLGELGNATWDSFRVSLPACLVALGLALPLAFLSNRYPSVWSRVAERSAYLGYATPSLAFGLGLIFFALNTTPILYQTAALLVVAYALHFLAQAVGPIRAGLHAATPRVEEAARSLGLGPIETFRSITLPILRPGLIAGGALVFLSCVKELPLTFLLAPLNFDSLALNVWGYASEALFDRAAPHALAIVLLASTLLAIFFRRAEEDS